MAEFSETQAAAEHTAETAILFRAEVNPYSGERFWAASLADAIEFADNNFRVGAASNCPAKFNDRNISVWTGSKFTPAWLVDHNANMADLGYNHPNYDPCLAA